MSHEITSNNQADSLSIIICTYNRCELLKECIESVLPHVIAQSKCLIDIIIVDNNSKDETKHVVEQFDSPYIRYEFEPKQGLSHARNKGFNVASSSWVAYLDDDAIVHEDWVDRIIWLIENTEFDAFGGIYLPWYRDGRKAWYLDEYATNKSWMKYSELSVLKKKMFSGGNCVFKKKLLHEVGGFPTELGMTGDTIAYGEESFVQAKLRERGYTLGFDPELLIDHYVAPYKQTFTWFFDRAKASGEVFWQSNQVSPNWPNILFAIALIIPLLIREILSCTKKILFDGYGVANVYISVSKMLTFHFSKISSGIKARFKRKNG